MNEHIDKAVNQAGQEMVNASADIIAKDVKAVILGGEEFPAPESPVPSVLHNVKPLSLTRRLTKRKAGYARPELPRFATGNLVNSIRAEFGDLRSAVDSDAISADGQQEGTSGGWMDEFGQTGGTVPARPFMGVSERAYQQAETMCRNILDRRLNELPDASADLTI